MNPELLQIILQNPEFQNISEDLLKQIISHFFEDNKTSTTSSAEITGYHIYTSIHQYVAPFIFILGLIGNILNLFVLRKTDMLKVPTSFFLQALSVFDTMILIFGLLPEWTAKVFKFNFQLQSDILCKSLNYLLYTSSHISAWLVVVLTMNRYILVCKPLLAITECTASKAKKHSFIVILFYLAVNAHFFWTVGLKINPVNGKLLCEGIGKYEYFTLKILPFIDGGLYAVIPSLIILTLNNFIILKFRNRDMRRNQAYVDNHENRLTQVLLLVSICFVIASVPVITIMIMVHYWNSLNQSLPDSVWIARGLSDMLMYLNHSINIFLYSISGTKFRKVLSRLFGLGKKGENMTSYKHANQLVDVTDTSV